MKFEIEMDTGGHIMFDKIKEDQILGVIFSDGVQEPLIKFGLLKNNEISNLSESFFNMKFKIELDTAIVDTKE